MYVYKIQFAWKLIFSFFSTCHFASLPLSLLDLIFSNLPRTSSWYQSREGARALDRSDPLAIAHGLTRRKFKEDSKKWRYEGFAHSILNRSSPFISNARGGVECARQGKEIKKTSKCCKILWKMWRNATKNRRNQITLFKPWSRHRMRRFDPRMKDFDKKLTPESAKHFCKSWN